MTKMRTGSPSLAYMGVEASTPPQQVTFDRLPTINDYTSFDLGTLWLAIIDETSQFLYVLAYKGNHVATWILLTGGGGAGTITRVDGGLNINTVDPTGPIVTVNLDLSIHQPITSSGGDEGVYYLGAVGGVGGNTFLHGRGTQNTFVGQSSGNLLLNTSNARSNTGCGFQTLRDNVGGENNLALGQSCLAVIADGDSNVGAGSGCMDQATELDNSTSVGADSLGQILTGDGNIALGYRSGFNYTSNEELNLVIGNEGTVGENFTIRIGNDTDHVDTYIAACWGGIVGGDSEIMIVDSDGKIGSTKGDNGEILIGATAGPPQWSKIASADGSVIINSGVNSIDLSVGGAPGGGATTFNTDVAGPAVVLGNVINILGDGIIQTDGTVANTVTVELPGSVQGDLLMTNNLGDTVWGNITSTGASITVSYVGDTINLEAVGAGGGANTFTTDVGNAVAVAGTIKVLGGDNINTEGATDEVTVNLNAFITLPDANAAGTEGVYYLGGNNFMHNFGVAGASYNTFLGEDAGNLTHASSVDCTGIGYQSQTALTTGTGNSSLASGSCRDLTTGSNNAIVGLDGLLQGNSSSGNSILGANGFNGIVTGNNNVGIGLNAGSNCTAADSDNIMISNTGTPGDSDKIRIGTTGTHDNAFFAGIHGVTPAGATQTVIIDANGELGSAAGGGGGTVTSVTGGANINTTGTAADPIVNLDLSIYQPVTNINGVEGGYFLGGNRFMHGIGTHSTYLGELAGKISTTGNFDNTAIGYNSQNVIASDYNTSVGAHSLELATSGERNSFLGAYSGRKITTLDSNVGIGYLTNSTYNTSTNTSVGAYSFQNVSGNNGVAIGYNAGKNVGGYGGTFVGSNSATVYLRWGNAFFGTNSGRYNTGYNNTLIGENAGSNTGFTGSDNIIIGGSAGGSYSSSESSNIIIGRSLGTVLDVNTIRIGKSGTGAGEQDRTYVAGIHDAGIDVNTSRSVYVDSTGKLGTTGGNVAGFLYILNTPISNVTGDGSVYRLGLNSTLTKIYDQGSNVYAGGSTYDAFFTAPTTGLYFIEVQFLVTGLIAPPPPATPVNSDPNIITSNRTYSLINSVYQYQTSGEQSYFYNAVCDMDVGDTARWILDINFDGTKTLGVGATQTFISGYRITNL